MSTPFLKVNWAKTNFSRANKSAYKNHSETHVLSILFLTLLTFLLQFFMADKETKNKRRQAKNERVIKKFCLIFPSADRFCISTPMMMKLQK